jgi:hypothetical protein
MRSGLLELFCPKGFGRNLIKAGAAKSPQTFTSPSLIDRSMPSNQSG